MVPGLLPDGWLVRCQFPSKRGLPARPSYGPVLSLQLRQLEMQCEQECEEKRVILHEKRDLEGLIATLCEQVRRWSLIGHVTGCHLQAKEGQWRASPVFSKSLWPL